MEGSNEARLIDALEKIAFELEQRNRIKLAELDWKQEQWGYD